MDTHANIHTHIDAIAERRRRPRLPFHPRALLGIDDCEHQGILVDISLNGAVLAGFAGPAGYPGRACRFGILSLRGREVARAQGHIAYTGGDTVGVRFHNLDDEAVRDLTRIVELNLGDSKLLNRKFGVLGSGPACSAERRFLFSCPPFTRRRTDPDFAVDAGLIADLGLDHASAPPLERPAPCAISDWRPV